MPIGAVQKVARGRNGVAAFILQCRRLEFHYCDWMGSSMGMNSFIKHTLPAFARANPSVEVHISPRPNHDPIIRAHYINGNAKELNVKKMTKEQILQEAELMRDASGNKEIRTQKKVESMNEGVRGIWSPFHGVDHERSWKI